MSGTVRFRGVAAMLAVLAAAMLCSADRAAAQAPPTAPTFAPTQQRTLTAGAVSAARCDRPASATSAGVARTVWTAPAGGFVTVTLKTSSGSDWDLGLFDSQNRRVAGSLSAGSREIAQSWVKAGRALTIQGCRVAGQDASATVTIAFAGVAAPPAGAPPQLVSVAYKSSSDLERIEDLGLDLTHNTRNGRADVIVADDAQRKLLGDAGFDDVQTKIADLADHFRRSQAADANYGMRVKKGEDVPVPPSGRTTYRVLTDYQNDMKQLAADYPSIVKQMTLPRRSYQGRELEGVEIAKDVHAAEDDGRPVYLVVAMHHAREWPSSEAAMEFAIMLAKGYGSNARITELLTRARVVVVPLINPDGFVASRGFPADPADVLGGGGDHAGIGVDPNFEDPCAGQPGLPAPSEVCGALRTCLLTGEVCDFDLYLTEGIAPPGGIFSYRRKNCAGQVPDPRTPCELQYGVDPNRNYGQFWGGPGSDADPTSQSYRGPSPWSEPETTAVHEYSQQRQITAIITIHNVAALILRPPGTSTGGKAPDEPRLKEIGDAMGRATGYKSQYGFELYDTAGTTEDWNYAAQGAYGFTIEIGPANGEFHMPYETGFVREWTGDTDAARAAGGGGLREALLATGEAAANQADHAIIEGRTKAGRVLRVRKDFTTPSWGAPFCRSEVPLLLFNIPATDDARCLEKAEPFEVDDHLDTTLPVTGNGRFEWHVNPSTRPFLLKDVEVPGEITETKEVFEGNGDVNPSASDVQGEAVETVHTFTVGATEGLQRLTLDLEWDLQPEDFDLRLCRVVSEDQCEPIGKGSGTAPGSSGNFPGEFEHIDVVAPPVGTYRATVVRYATAMDDYRLTLTRFTSEGSTTVPGRREPWILTCETPDGTVLQRAEVIVDRGQKAKVDLKTCTKADA